MSDAQDWFEEMSSGIEVDRFPFLSKTYFGVTAGQSATRHGQPQWSTAMVKTLLNV